MTLTIMAPTMYPTKLVVTAVDARLDETPNCFVMTGMPYEMFVMSKKEKK